MNNSSPTISGNTITGNTADFDGGGIVVTDNSFSPIENKIIRENEASEHSGGIIVNWNSNLLPSTTRPNGWKF